MFSPLAASTAPASHLPALDGLRGLAVLLVLASHAANAGLPVLPGLSLSGTGKSGVYLFFVLSGYLLTRILLAKPAAAWRQGHTWADYAWRRVLRIWPVYLVVLLASAALTALGVTWWPFALDGAALVRHLMLQEGMSVLWSIPVEFKYYLWLPLVALGFRLAGGPWLALPLLALLLAFAAWLWPAGASLVNDIRLGPYLPLFFCGAFAAWVSLRWQSVAVTGQRRAVLLGALAGISLVATVPSVWRLLFDDAAGNDVNHRWFLFFGVAWSALLLAVLHGPARLRRPFEWAALRWSGRVSFSAYLWHMPVLAYVLGPLALQGAVALLALLAGTALASWLSYRLFEAPFQGLRWPPLLQSRVPR